MAESLQSAQLIRATQVAHDTEVRHSANGMQFATFGETGLGPEALDRMLEAVPGTIAAALRANTYYFVPLALREAADAMVATASTDEYTDAAICHRNVDLGANRRGVFISTRLLHDRFALSFEFFINVAHAFVDQAGVPAAFAELAWQQALANTKGETSMDAWESRNLARGRTATLETEPAASRRRAPQQPPRPFNLPAIAAAPVVVDEKERKLFEETAFSDAVAIYLLSLALDFDYSELREREYPLLAPNALAARLRLVAELFPPNAGYDFAIRYRRRA